MRCYLFSDSLTYLRDGQGVQKSSQPAITAADINLDVEMRRERVKTYVYIKLCSKLAQTIWLASKFIIMVASV